MLLKKLKKKYIKYKLMQNNPDDILSFSCFLILCKSTCFFLYIYISFGKNKTEKIYIYIKCIDAKYKVILKKKS